MEQRQHALIIGGTGMLSGVCQELAKAGWNVSVIGRSRRKFDPLVNKYPSRIFSLIVDYNSEEMMEEATRAIAERGSFDLIISWTPNYAALEAVCQLNSRADSFQLIHVKGSGRFFHDEAVSLPSNCRYKKVYLGYVIENGESRWLTHTEISEGVLGCLHSGEPAAIIGQIHPYHDRPK